MDIKIIENGLSITNLKEDETVTVGMENNSITLLNIKGELNFDSPHGSGGSNNNNNSFKTVYELYKDGVTNIKCNGVIRDRLILDVLNNKISWTTPSSYYTPIEFYDNFYHKYALCDCVGNIIEIRK